MCKLGQRLYNCFSGNISFEFLVSIAMEEQSKISVFVNDFIYITNFFDKLYSFFCTIITIITFFKE